jgi:hypothetical protein
MCVLWGCVCVCEFAFATNLGIYYAASSVDECLFHADLGFFKKSNFNTLGHSITFYSQSTDGNSQRRFTERQRRSVF